MTAATRTAANMHGPTKDATWPLYRGRGGEPEPIYPGVICIQFDTLARSAGAGTRVRVCSAAGRRNVRIIYIMEGNEYVTRYAYRHHAVSILPAGIMHNN